MRVTEKSGPEKGGPWQEADGADPFGTGETRSMELRAAEFGAQDLVEESGEKRWVWWIFGLTRLARSA